MDHTHACNDLTHFEYVVHTMTGNRSYIFEFAETCGETLVKPLWVNLFLGGLYSL